MTIVQPALQADDRQNQGRPIPDVPGRIDLYYGGEWRAPKRGGYFTTIDPATGRVLCEVADATAEDIDACVEWAERGFAVWSRVLPLERARIMREIAATFRENAEEIAYLDALNSGNPIREMISDAKGAAAWFDFYAGLVTEMKGNSIPFGPGAVNYSVREPIGVVARIVAFNHPFMFAAGKIAAPMAAGNAVIIKSPDQAPLSAHRLVELLKDKLPPGVVNVVSGSREAGETLSTHPGIGMVTLIGSVPTGRAVMRSASSTLKPVILELGGKNALVAFADADPEKVAEAAIAGMNFGWCGQSCGSTSRLFLHADIHDAVTTLIAGKIARYKPGIPTDWETTMGSVVSRKQHERILDYIASAQEEGATLLCGGRVPDEPHLRNGFFIQPTVFTNVTQTMRIASEEIFGPVLSVLKWTDEEAMYRDVNALEYGLTGSIWTNSLQTAHRAAERIQSGYIWINKVGTHFLGAPFGGYKQSGIGKENSLAELLSFTREKNIHISFDA